MITDPVHTPQLTFSLQALLHRHESYIAEAEEDRQRLLTNIDTLEHERHDLQDDNSRIMAENRGLASQLDALNNAVAESDAQVNSLTVTLESTEAELRRVSAAAARAAELEHQLINLEAEQAVLQEGLVSAQEGEKAAVQRWKRAEATLREVQEQVDQLEREACDDRERHAELMQRMERRRTVERELDGAAGRLKGAAAAAAHDVGRQPVVSRFVRDILQDNANLQIGVTEMRELLESSNQEVQSLRDQVLRGSRPGTAEDDEIESEGGGGRPLSSSARPTPLSQELDRRISSEYHIHHHYHPLVNQKEKPRLLARRMSKKRRSVGSPAMLHSAAHLRNASTSSASTINSPASASPSRRWSYQTPATDSLASSPTSTAYKPTSIYDSMPTSPETPCHQRQKDPFPDTVDRVIDDELAELDMLPWNVPAIPEEREELSSSFGSPSDLHALGHARRQAHGDFFSVAGMDIHSPTHTRPRSRAHAQAQAQAKCPRSSRRNLSCGGDLLPMPPPPITSTTTVTADGQAPSMSTEKSPRRLLETFASGSSNGTGNGSGTAERSASGSGTEPSRKPSLSRRVGGWVRGRWSMSSTPAPASSSASASASTSTTSGPESTSGSTVTEDRPTTPTAQSQGPMQIPPTFREPGVNQKGPIWGFKPAAPAPAVVQVDVDGGLLRESLAE